LSAFNLQNTLQGIALGGQRIMRTIAKLIVTIGVFVASNAYAEESSRWIAVAATHWKDGGGTAHSAIGYSGIRRSEDEAAASALDACNSSGGVGCKVLGAWDSGCIYITSGSSADKAGYGAGESVAQALNNCRGEGLVCKPPVGGCIE
jgi:hypothetical protein